MHPMLNIAIRAARKAGDHIAKSLENKDKITTKQKIGFDFVTNVDKEAEAIIINTIQNSYPDHNIIAKEQGLINGADNSVQWIINPLDGTSNFIKSISIFAVSIAVCINGKTEVACIYDPMQNDLFTARRGAGAQLNSSRIRTPKLRDLHNTILATAFPATQRSFAPAYMQILNSLTTECADFRSLGSSSLSICYAAAGRVDGYFKLGLKPWDMAAAELIAREAGAIITDFAGGMKYMQSGNIVVASPKAVQSILKHIRKHASENMLK